MKLYHASYVVVVLIFLLGPSLLSQEEEKKNTGTEVMIPEEDPVQEGETEGIRLCRLDVDQKLWSGPGINFKVVRKAQAGLLLEIIGEKGGYFRVRVPDGFQCYIYTEYLEVDTQSMGTVTGSRVRLRSIPQIEGDYPIFQVDQGEKLMVWDRVGEWYCVTAPEEAYLYVLKDKVSMVEMTEEVNNELTHLQGQREQIWKSHQRGIQDRLKEEQKNQELHSRFQILERSTSEGFEGKNLEELVAGYKGIAAAPPDEATKQLAEARVRELEAVIARRKAEQKLNRREAAWRKEREKLTHDLDKYKQILPEPSAHDKTGIGKMVRVIGVVDTTGPEPVLKGGKSLDHVRYRLLCSDGRYLLPDFQGKRIRVQGRMGDVALNDPPPLVAIERIEILR